MMVHSMPLYFLAVVGSNFASAAFARVSSCLPTSCNFKSTFASIACSSCAMAFSTFSTFVSVALSSSSSNLGQPFSRTCTSGGARKRPSPSESQVSGSTTRMACMSKEEHVPSAPSARAASLISSASCSGSSSRAGAEGEPSAGRPAAKPCAAGGASAPPVAPHPCIGFGRGGAPDEASSAPASPQAFGLDRGGTASSPPQAGACAPRAPAGRWRAACPGGATGASGAAGGAPDKAAAAPRRAPGAPTAASSSFMSSVKLTHVALTSEPRRVNWLSTFGGRGGADSSKLEPLLKNLTVPPAIGDVMGVGPESSLIVCLSTVLKRPLLAESTPGSSWKSWSIKPCSEREYSRDGTGGPSAEPGLPVARSSPIVEVVRSRSVSFSSSWPSCSGPAAATGGDMPTGRGTVPTGGGGSGGGGGAERGARWPSVARGRVGGERGASHGVTKHCLIRLHSQRLRT
mmetsp:Transcript_44073/g.139985  ORF Transcript_44073/g.139985 Transcript_44073/m.139985 type:complete len:459 (-) Transcript_44073:953-2329(-)